MANVLNRTTKEYLLSVNTPDFPPNLWIINPDLSAVQGFPSQYWTITGDVVTLQTPSEREATDDAIFVANIDLTQEEPELFGDGNDGDVTISVDTTLSQDLYARKLIVDPGFNLNTNGYRIFASKGVIANGVIRNNGGNAVGATAGTAAPTGSLNGGGAGAAGGTGAGAASAALNTTAVIGHGGRGGNGGNGSGGTGGTSGAIISNNNARVRPRRFDAIAFMMDMDAGVAGNVARFAGGTGGAAGGGGGGGNSGGGGGGGGGIIVIVAPFVMIATTGALQARGGNGANGVSGNTGGGGGGGGGIVATITGSLRDRGLRDVSGGTPGNGTGTGLIGVAGSAGRLINLKVR